MDLIRTKTVCRFEVDDFVIYGFIKPCTGERTVTIGIETTSITSSGSKWVGKHSRATSASNSSFMIAHVYRTPYRWQAEIERGTASGEILTGGFVSGDVVKIATLNGASWVRSNNPEYATMISINIASDTFPAGSRFEIYAHDKRT